MRWMSSLHIFCAGTLIFFVAASAPSTVAAEEWISGGVQGIDRNRGTLTLALAGHSKTVTVVAVSGRIPKNIHRSAAVQAWGHFQSRNRGVFLARRIIRIDSRPSPYDPTGVRKRLHKRFRQ